MTILSDQKNREGNLNEVVCLKWEKMERAILVKIIRFGPSLP